MSPGAIARTVPGARALADDGDYDPRPVGARQRRPHRTRCPAEVRAIEDPEQRRAALAAGFIRVIGREIPAADADRLRAMVRDSADVIEDPGPITPIYMAPFAQELRALELPLLVLAAAGDERAAAIARALAEQAPAK